jgi:hypothetical protein
MFPVGVGLWGCSDEGLQAAVPLDVILPLFVLCWFVELHELLTAYPPVIIR